MTPTEREITARLKTLTGKFANFKEGRFVDQLDSWMDRPMTPKGREYLLRLLDRYQKDIPDHQELKSQHLDEQLGEIQ